MKVVTVQLIAADDADVSAIGAHLEQSGLLNEWPCFAWSSGDATDEMREWYESEYSDEDEES